MTDTIRIVGEAGLSIDQDTEPNLNGAGIIVPMTRTFAFSGGVNYRRVIFADDTDNETSVFAGVRIAFR